MSITLYVKLKKKKGGGEKKKQQEGAGLGRLDGLSGYMVGSGADVTLQPAFASLGKCLKVIVEHLMVVVTAAVCM